MILKINYLVFAALLLCIANETFSQNDKYMHNKEYRPGGVFTEYKLDSNNVGRIFYQNGKVKCEVKIVIKKSFFGKNNWIFNGFWHSYYENGQLESQGKYRRGKKNGIWEYFNENGKLLRIIFYNRDKLIDMCIQSEDDIPTDIKKNNKGVWVAD